jgi:hypothetical protein
MLPGESQDFPFIKTLRCAVQTKEPEMGIAVEKEWHENSHH